MGRMRKVGKWGERAGGTGSEKMEVQSGTALVASVLWIKFGKQKGIIKHHYIHYITHTHTQRKDICSNVSCHLSRQHTHSNRA